MMSQRTTCESHIRIRVQALELKTEIQNCTVEIRGIHSNWLFLVTEHVTAYNKKKCVIICVSQ